MVKYVGSAAEKQLSIKQKSNAVKMAREIMGDLLNFLQVVPYTPSFQQSS